MTLEFALALVAFLASHAIPMVPKLRARLIEGLGRPVYLAVYSVTSVGLLLWLFSAAARAPYTPLWPALRSAPFWGMPLVFWLIAEGLIRPTPLSLGRPGPQPHGLSPFTRHPLPLALVVWTGLHILANPDLSHVVLFGLLGSFSAFSMVLIDQRKKRQMGPEWERLAQGSARLNPAGLSRIRPHGIAVALALGGYALALFAHPYFAGVPVLPQ